MVDVTQDQPNNQQQDQNQLSEEDLKDVNGGGWGLSNFLEDVAEKVGAEDIFNDVKGAFETITNPLGKRK